MLASAPGSPEEPFGGMGFLCPVADFGFRRSDAQNAIFAPGSEEGVLARGCRIVGVVLESGVYFRSAGDDIFSGRAILNGVFCSSTARICGGISAHRVALEYNPAALRIRKDGDIDSDFAQDASIPGQYASIRILLRRFRYGSWPRKLP